MQRTCVGCRSEAAAEELVRLVVGPDGEVVVDLAGGSFGRGAWVHARSECLDRAVPAGLARGLRTEVRISAEQVRERLMLAALRRSQGLIVAARRARKLEAGATAVHEAVMQRRAELVLVATDARASADLPWLEPLIASGRAQAFASKATLGAWLARPETALVAITDEGIARELRGTLAWTLLGRSRAASSGANSAVSLEAG